jgi:hypothetical protein
LEKGDIVKILGLFTQSESEISQSIKSLEIKFQDEKFTFYSDSISQEADFGNLYNGVFGKLFGNAKSSSKKLATIRDGGNYIRIGVDSEHTISLNTDSYCRIDIYFIETKDLIAFSNDLSLIDSLLNEYSNLDQISLAHSLSIYGNRPPKKRTFFTEIKRLGYRQKLIIKENILIIEDSIPQIKKINTDKKETEFLNEYYETFLNALEERSSESQNLVFFSSGWDSTAIAAGLVKIKGKRSVKCIIGEMRYSKQSGLINKFEIEKAERICKYLDVDLEVVKFDYSKELPANFHEIQNFLKQNQTPSLTAVNHFLLAEKASQIASSDSTVFAGEMSDGAHNLGFAQYMSIFHPNSIDFREYSDKMKCYLFGPSFIKFASQENLINDPVWKIFTNGKNIDFDVPKTNIDDRIKQFLISFFLRNSRLPFMPGSDLKLLTQHGSKLHQQKIYEEYFLELEPYFKVENMYSLYLYLYNSFHWQGSTVNGLEFSGDYFNLNVTNPFHDTNLIEILETMPEELGRGLELKPTKYPIKWMLENKLNYDLSLNGGLHSYLYDEDPNYNHSRDVLINSAFASLFKNNLNSTKLIESLDSNIFDLKYIENIIKEYTENNKVDDENISNLFSLCMHSLILPKC